MILHRWNLPPTEARRLQEKLRAELILAWDNRPINFIGGVDVSFPAKNRAKAAIVVLTYPALVPITSVTAQAPVQMPYIPGLLSFREAPVILAAWDMLREMLAGGARLPDVIFVDGQGIAHPRGFGLAAHVGLWLQRPTIGVAKSRLYGQHSEPGPAKGELAPLTDQKDSNLLIGAVVRTRENVKPVYISPGNLIDVDMSVKLSLACATRYRLPEPTHWAHRVAGGAKLPVGERP